MIIRKTRFEAELADYGILVFDPKNYIKTPQTQALKGFIYEGKEKQDLEFLEITHQIPAQVGLTFGISFYVLANNSHREKEIKLTTVIQHPPMIHPETQVIATSFSDTFMYTTPYYQYLFFHFDYLYELVKGTWTFRVEYANTCVVEKSFEVE